MQVQITGRHLEITEGLRSIVERKSERLRHHLQHIIDIQVILAVDKLDHIAECTITSDIKTFFCEARSGDMYESVDRLFAKMERQIRRYLEKMQSLGRHEERIHDHLEMDQRSSNGPRISRIEEVAPKPMTPHEAVLQVEATRSRYQLFVHSGDPAFREALIMREHDGFTALLPSHDGWRQHSLALDPTQNLSWGSQSDYHVPELTIEEALQKVHELDLSRQVFYDPDTDSLNILYPSKEGQYALLTSGEGAYRGRSDLGVM